MDKKGKPNPSETAARAGRRGSGGGNWAHRLLGADVGRLFVITIIVFAVMCLLQPSLFLSWNNFSSMAFQFPEFAILALAMMLTMLTGGIDLSVVGLANLSAIIAALILRCLVPDAADLTPGVVGAMALAIVAALASGAIGGLLNGLSIAFIGIPPILATLGTGLIFTGVAIVITGGAAVLGLPAAFSVIGNGTILLIPIPVPLLMFAVLAILVAIMLNRTGFGMRVYLLGTNALAARFAGIDNAAVTVRTYVLSGFFGAIAGIVMMSRANSAKADYGSSYLLLAILIAVLGGTNPYGGFGKVSGLVLAVLSLQFLSSGFNMLGISNFAKDMMWGALLLLVMVINNVRIGRSASR